MKEEFLLSSIGQIDDDLVEKAANKPTVIFRLRPWMVTAACLALIVTLLLPRFPVFFSGMDGTTGDAAAGDAAGGDDAASDSTGSDGADDASGNRDDPGGEGCTMPGDISPVLWYEGRGFAWVDVVHTPDPDQGWEAVGALSGTTAEEGPLADLWLYADFAATGTVYRSEEYPDALYVCMTTDWLQNTYVYFLVPPLNNQHMICFEDRLYLFRERSTAIQELPDGYIEAGKIEKFSVDKVPDEERETTGVYGGSSVWKNPQHPDTIYVNYLDVRRDGTYQVYVQADALTRANMGQLTIAQNLMPAE